MIAILSNESKTKSTQGYVGWIKKKNLQH
jgi:hypothetical protein